MGGVGAHSEDTLKEIFLTAVFPARHVFSASTVSRKKRAWEWCKHHQTVRGGLLGSVHILALGGESLKKQGITHIEK